MLVIGFGSLGQFPIYYAFTQELSVSRMGRVTGTLSFLTWTATALVQEPIGRWLDRTDSYSEVTFLAGLMPMIGFLALFLSGTPRSRASSSRRRSTQFLIRVLIRWTHESSPRSPRSWDDAASPDESGGEPGAGPGQPPRPPREEQAAFVLADPELTIELVAAEPEVASPVAIAWDEEGRLFVAEMLDYPTATTSGRIRMLEDRDGDGRYEHATVFADGLPFPNGVLPCWGGLLVTAAPDIWFLKITTATAAPTSVVWS